MTQTLTERADNVSRPVLIFSAVKLMENDDEQSHTKGPGINLSSPSMTIMHPAYMPRQSLPHCYATS